MKINLLNEDQTNKFLQVVTTIHTRSPQEIQEIKPLLSSTVITNLFNLSMSSGIKFNREDFIVELRKRPLGDRLIIGIKREWNDENLVCTIIFKQKLCLGAFKTETIRVSSIIKLTFIKEDNLFKVNKIIEEKHMLLSRL